MIARSPEEIETIIAGNIAEGLRVEDEKLTDLGRRIQSAIDRLTEGHDAHAEIPDFERPFFVKIMEADHA